MGRKNLDDNLKAHSQTLPITCFLSPHMMKHFYTCKTESDMLERSTMNMFSVKYTACHMFTAKTCSPVATAIDGLYILESHQWRPA